jgi:hypothetical protein
MTAHQTHEPHTHVHGDTCGHAAIKHDDHTDYLHDGHLHYRHEGHVDEHQLSTSAKNPSSCTPGHACGGHDKSHKHNTQCGHEGVPHEGHVDYVVAGHLHHAHDAHCDDHGPVAMS